MKLALIGVGLIGGSFARAVRAAGRASHIVGFDTQREVLQRALELGVIDEIATSAASAVEGADLVMVATPVGSMTAVMREIAPFLSATCVVTDAGSVKGRVVAAAADQLGPASMRFVPGHPIAGSERSGIDHSNVALYRDSVVVLTPVAETSSEATATVEKLWRDVGGIVKHMTPEEHDNVFATVSHLPHLLAFALVAQIASQPDSERKFGLAGAGFRDFTRIAASDPALWSDICISNGPMLSSQLRNYRTLLHQLQDAVDTCDREAVLRLFAQASTAKRISESNSQKL